MKRPDLRRLVEQGLVQQMGDGNPFALPWDVINVCPGPQNQVHIVLNTCSIPATQEFF